MENKSNLTRASVRNDNSMTALYEYHIMNNYLHQTKIR